jgi:hypothetical protein
MMLSPKQVLAAVVWAFVSALVACALLFAMLACAPKAPDPSLVLWEQPSPQIAAQAHAREKGLVPYLVAGVSMEPMIVAGDWAVSDPAFPFASLREGDVIIYAPDWTTSLVIHACAAKSGEAWIMNGINNAHYENGPNGGMHVYSRHYRGKVVQIYTRRYKT